MEVYMKIYVLLNEKVNGVDTIFVSENINDIWMSICEKFTQSKGYAKLEIWEKGKCTCNIKGNEILSKIVDEVQGTKAEKNEFQY